MNVFKHKVQSFVHKVTKIKVVRIFFGQPIDIAILVLQRALIICGECGIRYFHNLYNTRKNHLVVASKKGRKPVAYIGQLPVAGSLTQIQGSEYSRMPVAGSR